MGGHSGGAGLERHRDGRAAELLGGGRVPWQCCGAGEQRGEDPRGASDPASARGRREKQRNSYPSIYVPRGQKCIVFSIYARVVSKSDIYILHRVKKCHSDTI